MKNLVENYYFETPGNLIKYVSFFNDKDINIQDNKLDCILYLIEQYKKEKNPETLTFISLFIENFYNDLFLKKNDKLNSYFMNFYKISRQIYNIKKFNLDEKNNFLWIKETLQNETR